MSADIIKIYLVIGIVLLVLLSMGMYYALQPILNAPADDRPIPFTTSGPGGPLGTASIEGALEDIEKYVRAGIDIYTKDKRTVIVRWKNLPTGTSKLSLYRQKIGSSKWSFWQTISAGSGSGEATLTLGDNDDAGTYLYYGQAYSSSGATLWASRPTETQEVPPPDSPPSTSTPSTPPASPPTSPPPGSPPPPAPTSTPPPPPTPSPTPTPPTTPPPPPPPTGIPFYGPNGQITGYVPFQTASFWVTHTDTKHIEIGWQNLPPPTDLIVVSRSASSSGPWLELLRQDNPNATGPDSIRLIDFTLNDTYYYSMDAYSSSSAIAHYGPEVLGPISQ